MDRFRLHLRPDEMTPEERLERVVELLATAAIRRVLLPFRRCAKDVGIGCTSPERENLKSWFC